MNELQTFTHPAFGKVRMLYEEGKPLFCGKDVCIALGYANARDTLSKHCRYVAKRDVPHPQAPESSKTLSMAFIPESDLYRLITHSKLPAAERFEHWVFDEVLPTIRQTGAYAESGAPAAVPMEQLLPVVQTVAAEVIKQLLPMLSALGNAPVTPAPASRPPLDADVLAFVERDTSAAGSYNRCKIETFPSDIRAKVDAMLSSMCDEQCLNFSRVARFCVANGYSVSYPAVKRYFLRHFSA